MYFSLENQEQLVIDRLVSLKQQSFISAG